MVYVGGKAILEGGGGVFRAISEYYFCGIRSPIDIMESKSDKLAKHVAYN